MLGAASYIELIQEFLLTPDESPLSEHLQALASFTRGVLVLREDEALPQARVQESGRFRMVHDETLQSQTERAYQQATLAGLSKPELWLVYACMTTSSYEMLEPLLEYQHEHTETDPKPAEARERYAQWVRDEWECE